MCLYERAKSDIQTCPLNHEPMQYHNTMAYQSHPGAQETVNTLYLSNGQERRTESAGGEGGELLCPVAMATHAHLWLIIDCMVNKWAL